MVDWNKFLCAENPFGQRAISKAADIIAGHPTRIVSGAEMGKLQGIGKGSVAKVGLCQHLREYACATRTRPVRVLKWATTDRFHAALHC